jgi:hypothetical protein
MSGVNGECVWEIAAVKEEEYALPPLGLLSLLT